MLELEIYNSFNRDIQLIIPMNTLKIRRGICLC